MRIGNREFLIAGKTYVMGILNITPDSFSDGGRWNDPDRALFHVEEMLKDGMDLLDIGGESSRPGHKPIPAGEETDRILPVLEAVKSRFDVPISLDTCKTEVAKAGIDAGADMVNDIWGLKQDPGMAKLIAKSGLPCCLMHNRKEAVYQDFLAEVKADLSETLAIADRAGIPREKILLDPGVGFGKTYEQNLKILNHLELFRELGCPLLLGTSRKSVIGLTLDLPADERLEGTLATTALGVMKGVAFIRVHDVKENVRLIRMLEAVLHSE